MTRFESHRPELLLSKQVKSSWCAKREREKGTRGYRRKGAEEKWKRAVERNRNSYVRRKG